MSCSLRNYTTGDYVGEGNFTVYGPMIEKHLKNATGVKLLRKNDANTVAEGIELLSAGSVMNSDNDVLEALFRIIRSPFSQRLILYLPFYVFKNMPKCYHDDFMDAWYSLLRIHDVRENFHFGDTFEVDARPGELPRVVKCVHLLPWMLEYGIITYPEVYSIMNGNKDNEVLLQSFRDILPILKDRAPGCISRSEVNSVENSFRAVTDHLPPKPKYEPLYISEKRKVWLEEMQHDTFELLIPNVKLDEPRSKNLAFLWPKIRECGEKLDDNSIIMIGGSLLKGYGTTDSDFDSVSFFDYFQKTQKNPLFPDARLDPFDAHLFFNSIWISHKPYKELVRLANEVLRYYAEGSESVKRYALEQIESDLLQYRLLHKGFAKVTGKRIYETSKYVEMEGDCPFYDDDYRTIATKIYARYVWF